MNNYNYSSYCQRPDEVDLGVYQLPGSPIHSPPSRERQFLQELRSLRAGIESSPQSYREVPIALSPSFNVQQPQVSSLHRTFSDSNVILSPPWEKTLRSTNGRGNPSWMENPPPPFANFKAPEGYSSLERGSSLAKAPAGRGFFKCASPTPWQSSDNLAREEVIPPRGGQQQRFFSPSPRQESSRSDWELDRNWDNTSHAFEQQPQQEMQQPARMSKWDNMSNVQQQGPSRSPYEQDYPYWGQEQQQQRRETSLSRRSQWEQQPPPRERSSRRSDWESLKQRQPQSRDHSLIRNPEWERNSQPNWEINQNPWQHHQGPAYNGENSEPEWREDNLQHRQQVQRDLLQEIQQHRQQQAARMQAPGINNYRQPFQREGDYDEGISQQHSSNSTPPDTELKWRSPTAPLAPLFENRTSRKSNWEASREQQRRNNERPWNGGPIYNNVPQEARDLSRNRYGRENRPYNHGRDEDPMTRSQEYGRSGVFARTLVPGPGRAMTEPPNQISLLDKAMQNRSAGEYNSYALGPELEMDLTVTHFRNGDGKVVSSRNHSPQRHSYAGTFSEFSRSDTTPYNSYSRNQMETRPRSFALDDPNSIISSPAVSPPLAMEQCLPTSPIQTMPPQNVLYRREQQNHGPKWELDSLYGMAPPGSERAQRSFMRNQEMAQRSTVTTPMYGRGTLNERQPDRASVERTTAVVNPMIVEPPPKVAVKHAGILLNPNETRKTNKRRVMFVCDRDDEDYYYDKDNLGGADSEAPAHVKAYEAAVEEPLSRFSSLSNQIGGDVAEMAKKFNGAMDLERHFLWQAASQNKATGDAFQKLFQPVLDAAGDITAYKDSKRQSPYFNHLNAISEAINALGWVTIEKTPAPFIKEALDSAMFYLNRIRMEYKEKDKKHIDWVAAFIELMTQLQTFVRQTHTTGLVWNSAPGNAPAGAPKPAASAGGPPKGGAPPPPPPPPAGLFDDVPKAKAPASDKDGRDALFAQLNQGSDITKGLKKVTSEMQTHKNPNLRTTSTVPSASSNSAASLTNSPARTPIQRPPKVELENGKQWTVEYHNGNKNIIVEITDKKQSVYIYKCENSTIQVKGKCNSVALDGCKKTAVVVDAVVAQIETINCQSVQIQTMGEMPTLSIQKTDGCQVYLSEASKDCEIVTSKSSEMNVLVPKEDGEFIELPLPEQFKTVYKGGKLVTTVSDIC